LLPPTASVTHAGRPLHKHRLQELDMWRFFNIFSGGLRKNYVRMMRKKWILPRCEPATTAPSQPFPPIEALYRAEYHNPEFTPVTGS